MKVAIVKYGMGNVASVQKILNKLGYQSIITDNHTDLKNSQFIILPGVGSFKKGMENLHERGLVDLLTDEIINKNKPFLGICLGMQLIATYGTEPFITEGLGWIDGSVVRINSANGLRIPHLGWNNVNSQHEIFYNEFNNLDYYFIHSYHFKASNKDDITLTVNYGQDIVAGLQKNNIYAVQFHPEKSQEAGMLLLNKILNKHA